MGKSTIKNLVEAFKDDPGYLESWKANIAMAFYDEYYRFKKKRSYISGVDLHGIANRAAENFLKLLMK